MVSPCARDFTLSSVSLDGASQIMGQAGRIHCALRWFIQGRCSRLQFRRMGLKIRDGGEDNQEAGEFFFDDTS